MKIIGLTGGIGSGKSTVARIFESLNVPVYYADDEAKKLMQNNTSLQLKIQALLGEEAYSNGALNRAYIAEIVFKDRQKLKALNELVHPEVRHHFFSWVDQQQFPYVIQENPLIYEQGQQDVFDMVIVVDSDQETRVKRVMLRDNVSEQQVLDRIANQLDDQVKRNAADYVIDNKTLDDTREQVLRIHQELLQ